METQINRKLDFQRLSWDFMSQVKQFLFHIFLPGLPLWSLFASVSNTGEWDWSPCSEQLPFICICKLNLNPSLNRWWNLTGCCGIWNRVQLQSISAEKSFAWKKSRSHTRKAELLQRNTFLFCLHLLWQCSCRLCLKWCYKNKFWLDLNAWWNQHTI